MRVLALSPHADDAEMGAGGYLRKLIELGVKAHIAAFSIARESVPAGAIVIGNPAREKKDR